VRDDKISEICENQMTICKVTGSVVSTQKNERFKGKKILVVQPLDLNMNPKGSDMIALDTVDAGIGDIVLVMKEGGSARIVFNDKKIPVQAVIVGVVDDIDIKIN
jgi:ethanolamine utilization protein EutN